MKALAVLLLIVALTNAQWVQTLSETALEQELDSGRHVWLVYRTSTFLLNSRKQSERRSR